MASNQERAQHGEELAASYLAGHGYQILERNFRFGHGELDIIAQKGEYVVFVEVKTRTSEAYGPPAYSITHGKQKQLIKVAQGYLQEKRRYNSACRFDVITVEFERGRPVLSHIENAFMQM